MDTETEYKLQLQKQLITGEKESSSITTTNVDDAYINGVFTGLSFRSLLMEDPYSVPSPSPYLLSLIPSPQNDDVAKLEKQKRRQKLSDRTRSLQKLLPMDKKMDMATVLEESYKYIKFLEAQLRVLESMPLVTTNNDGFGVDSDTGVMIGGDLFRLNRQELLQVVVNSQEAQVVLSSNGCCIHSVEQLVKLNNNNNNNNNNNASDEKQVNVLVTNTDSNF